MIKQDYSAQIRTWVGWSIDVSFWIGSIGQ